MQRQFNSVTPPPPHPTPYTRTPTLVNRPSVFPSCALSLVVVGWAFPFPSLSLSLSLSFSFSLSPFFQGVPGRVVPLEPHVSGGGGAGGVPRPGRQGGGEEAHHTPGPQARQRLPHQRQRSQGELSCPKYRSRRSTRDVKYVRAYIGLISRFFVIISSPRTVVERRALIFWGFECGIHPRPSCFTSFSC